jgi:hypothetical protein
LLADADALSLLPPPFDGGGELGAPALEANPVLAGTGLLL